MRIASAAMPALLSAFCSDVIARPQPLRVGRLRRARFGRRSTPTPDRARASRVASPCVTMTGGSAGWRLRARARTAISADRARAAMRRSKSCASVLLRYTLRNAGRLRAACDDRAAAGRIWKRRASIRPPAGRIARGAGRARHRADDRRHRDAPPRRRVRRTRASTPFGAAQCGRRRRRAWAGVIVLRSPECLAQLRSQRAETRVLVETTTLDIQSGEPAISHVRAAFAAGAHVITANKGPVAFAYRALAREARRGRRVVPVRRRRHGRDSRSSISSARRCRRRRFAAFAASSTARPITSSRRWSAASRSTARCARMQADGVAEADPSLDVDGWDAAAKTAALANVLLDAGITPHARHARGHRRPRRARVRAARVGRRRRLKLVASATRRGGGDATRRSSSRARRGRSARRSSTARAMRSSSTRGRSGRIVITQRDGGLEKTAYALFSDLVTVATASAAREFRLLERRRIDVAVDACRR